MTVKELKEKLNQFPDNLIIVVPDSDYDHLSDGFGIGNVYYTKG